MIEIIKLSKILYNGNNNKTKLIISLNKYKYKFKRNTIKLTTYLNNKHYTYYIPTENNEGIEEFLNIYNACIETIPKYKE